MGFNCWVVSWVCPWLCGLGLLDSCLLELYVLCLGFVFLAVWFTTCAFMLFHLFVLCFGFGVWVCLGCLFKAFGSMSLICFLHFFFLVIKLPSNAPEGPTLMARFGSLVLSFGLCLGSVFVILV